MAGGLEQRKQWRASPMEPPAFEQPADDSEAPAPRGALSWIALLLGGVGVAWAAAVTTGLVLAAPPEGLGPLRIASWIGLASAPLALLAALAVLLLRSGRSEATRYARAAQGLRAESERLAGMLTLLTRRIEGARATLAEQADSLATLGESAGARLAQVGGALDLQTQAVSAVATRLDDAAASARTDIGVMLADLPRAEAMAAALGERLRTLGEDAESGAGTLASQLEALEAASRGADQASAGAARRLAAELERIEGAAAAADRRIGDAAARLAEASGNALGDSATALDEVRRGVEAQAAALRASTNEARALIDQGGDEAGRALAQRLDQLGRGVDAIEQRMRGHESVVGTLVGQLEQALTSVEARFAALGDKGSEQTADLAEAIVALADHADGIGRSLGQGRTAADTLVGQAGALRQQVDAATISLRETVPQTLALVRRQTEDSLRALDGAGPRLDRMAEASEHIAATIGQNDATIARQQEALTAFGQAADARLGELTAQADAIHALLGRTDADLRNLAEGASSQLVDALLRVRETATQAAAHARDTLAKAIPQAVAQLSEESGRALTGVFDTLGTPQVAALGDASTRAVAAAQAAADRLARQLATMEESAAAIEARAADSDDQNFARQVGLLIEALNSAAIDVAKIFSNEPTDAAWAAYLKGDRGIFTRRAVHLLDAAGAKTIAARYGDDPEFREQTNRYIHDFEAMLRRVLAVRDGAAMGVTLLSSDAGKLYVALAQAIERLRR